MNSQPTAIYNATCWAEGKTNEEIKAEINRIHKMWGAGPDFQFPGNAHYQYTRMETLRRIVAN